MILLSIQFSDNCMWTWHAESELMSCSPEMATMCHLNLFATIYCYDIVFFCSWLFFFGRAHRSHTYTHTIHNISSDIGTVPFPALSGGREYSNLHFISASNEIQIAILCDLWRNCVENLCTNILYAMLHIRAISFFCVLSLCPSLYLFRSM